MGGFNQNQAFSPIPLAGDDRNVSGDLGYGNLQIRTSHAEDRLPIRLAWDGLSETSGEALR